MTPETGVLSAVDMNPNVTVVPTVAIGAKLLVQVMTTAAPLATDFVACTVALKVEVSVVAKPPVNSPASEPPTVKVHVTDAAADHIALLDVMVIILLALSAPVPLIVVANLMLVGVVSAARLGEVRVTEFDDRDPAVVVKPVTPVAATLSTVDVNENVTVVPDVANAARLLVHVMTTAALLATDLVDCTVATKVEVSVVAKPPVNSPPFEPPTVKVHVTDAAADHMALLDVMVIVLPALSAPEPLTVVANAMLFGVVP